MRDDVMSQITGRRGDYLRPTKRDSADINRETIAWFNDRWNNFEERLKIAPGKEVLRTLRSRLQEEFDVSLTDARIVDSMRRDDIPNDLQRLLQLVDKFRQSTP
jgi:hypothetical protein